MPISFLVPLCLLAYAFGVTNTGFNIFNGCWAFRFFRPHKTSSEFADLLRQPTSELMPPKRNLVMRTYCYIWWTIMSVMT